MIVMNKLLSRQIFTAFLMTLLLVPVVVAQTDSTEPQLQQVNADAEYIERIGKLQKIERVLAQKRLELDKLQQRLLSAKDLDEVKIKAQIAALQENIDELSLSFERIAVSGINLQSLEVTEEKQLDWRDELLQIARPILNSLKEATEKPRQIEELRNAINLFEQQLKAIDKAIESAVQLDRHEMSGPVGKELDELINSLRERRKNIDQSLEVSRIELKSLEVEDTRMFETAGNLLREFLLGRGLTLLIALVAGIGMRVVVHRFRSSREMAGMPALHPGRSLSP